MADAIDDLFRRFGKAFNKADVEEIAACVTDDFEWRLSAGGAPSGRVLKGKDDLRAHFADKSKAPREARYSEARIHRAGDKLFGTFRVTGIDHAGKPFDRYGIEQQAEIVRHTLLLRRGIPVAGKPELQAYEALLPFTP